MTAKLYTMAQYTPEWWQIRRGCPTASNCDRIITAVKGELASAHKGYIAELIGDELNPNYPETDERATAAMRRGTLMEPEARDFYETWTNGEVQQIGFITTECGRFGTSPDGLIGDEGVTEYKCPGPSVFAGWVIDDILPNDYKAQCHAHLLITGRRWCDFFAYLPGQPPFIKRVTADAFTEKLRDCLVRFDTAYHNAREKFGLSTNFEPCSLAGKAVAA